MENIPSKLDRHAHTELGGYKIFGHEDPHAHEWIKHMRKLDHTERRILFNQARRKGVAEFSPKEGVNLKLSYNQQDKSFLLHHEK